MTEKNCPICNNIAPYRLSKGTVHYNQCSNCKTIFCDTLDNDNKVGGGAEIKRNTQQNHLRICRIDELTAGEKKENMFILDWGAGHGLLIKDLIAAGYVNSHGYDAYALEFQRLPEKDKYHVVVSVETFEHFSPNFIEIDVIYRSLKKNGVVYVETGFLDAAWADGLEDEANPYISPEVGHSTVFTHHGLDVLMCRKGFVPCQKFNRHCHVYQKIEKK